MEKINLELMIRELKGRESSTTSRPKQFSKANKEIDWMAWRKAKL
jgi:hypothetical protein